MSLSLFCLSFSFPLENRECIKLLSQTLKACNEIIHVEWCLTHRKALTLVTEYYLSTLLSPAQQVLCPNSQTFLLSPLIREKLQKYGPQELLWKSKFESHSQIKCNKNLSISFSKEDSEESVQRTGGAEAEAGHLVDLLLQLLRQTVVYIISLKRSSHVCC